MNSGDFFVFVKLQRGFVKLQRQKFYSVAASAYLCNKEINPLLGTYSQLIFNCL